MLRSELELDSPRHITAPGVGIVLAFLVGLVVGALRAPVVSAGANLAEAGRSWTPETIALFVVAGIVGAVAVFALDRAAGGIEL